MMALSRSTCTLRSTYLLDSLRVDANLIFKIAQYSFVDYSLFQFPRLCLQACTAHRGYTTWHRLVLKLSITYAQRSLCLLSPKVSVSPTVDKCWQSSKSLSWGRASSSCAVFSSELYRSDINNSSL